MNTHTMLSVRESRRLAAEDRFLRNIERLETKADKMLGQLIREGKTVWYVYPPGGRYREGSRSELTDFLIRNKYVR